MSRIVEQISPMARLRSEIIVESPPLNQPRTIIFKCAYFIVFFVICDQ